MAPPLVRQISDTARWAAAFRARESERPDALFRDPLAGLLAGPRGFEIAAALSDQSHSASWVTRTLLFDRFIEREIARGVDTVVNLGAGLDTRPYRMTLPTSLRWFELDTPDILTYKETTLAGQTPCCRLERVGLDLLDLPARRAALAKLCGSGKKILVLTEGVLIYLASEDVAALAKELAADGRVQSWILEIASPAVLDTMRRTAGAALEQAGAGFQFGPRQGPAFFEPCGWNFVEARGVLRAAVKLGRTPIDPRFWPLIPDSPSHAQASLPWVRVCLFRSQGRASPSPI